MKKKEAEQLQVDYNEATGAAKLEPDEPAPKQLTMIDFEIEEEQKKLTAKKEREE